jgi:hypothetical protein
MKKTISLLAFTLILSIFTIEVQAQQGTKLTIWGGPQFVSLANVDDYFAAQGETELQKVPTYRAGGGIDLIYNFTDVYGVQSGVYYSQQGQKYSGFIVEPGTGDSIKTDFTSHMYLNYVRVPVMFRFNSEFAAEEQMSLSIYGGLQLGILRNVEAVKTSPGPQADLVARYPNFNFANLYKKTDLGIAAGAQFNIKLSPKLHTMLGLRYDRSFSTIENLSYDLPRDAPLEWQFPVSTKKLRSTDNSVRRPTRNMAVNLYTGLTISLSSGSGKTSAPPVTE